MLHYHRYKSAYLMNRGGDDHVVLNRRWPSEEALLKTTFPGCVVERDGRRVTLTFGEHVYFLTISNRFPFHDTIESLAYQHKENNMSRYLLRAKDLHPHATALRIATLMKTIHDQVVQENLQYEPAPLVTHPLHVLVFCHHQTFEGHFLSSQIRSLIDSYREDGAQGARIKTVDIHGTPDYKEDAFSPSFMQAHQGEFDLIFLPDCDGPWAKVQMNQALSPQERWFILKDYLYQIMSMVKPGGRVYFSKIISVPADLVESDPSVTKAPPGLAQFYFVSSERQV